MSICNPEKLKPVSLNEETGLLSALRRQLLQLFRRGLRGATLLVHGLRQGIY